MNLLVPIASLLGIEIASITERVRNAVILNSVMVMLAFVGVIFLIIAGFVALADVLGVVYAALSFAAGFLVLALAVYLGNLIGEGRHKREAVEKRRSSETNAFMATAAMTALPVLLKSSLVRNFGLPAAALAAFLLVRGGSEKSDD